MILDVLEWENEKEEQRTGLIYLSNRAHGCVVV